jgi:hypothetical protein
MKRKLSEYGVLWAGGSLYLQKTAASIETSLSRRPNPIYLLDRVGEIFTLKFIYLIPGAVLEKLTSYQLVKKFPALYGTWRFISPFTKARHLPLS